MLVNSVVNERPSLSILRQPRRSHQPRQLAPHRASSKSGSYNKSQRDALFLNFILVKNSTCFGQIYCPSSGVLVLYSQQLVFVILVMLTVC